MAETIVVIAPHPDDEVLGPGGTLIAHQKAGDTVICVIVTQAYEPEWSKDFLKKRPREIKRAHKKLGIEKSYTLGFPTVRLDQVGQQKINQKLQEVIDAEKPTIVYLPFGGDLNKDHRLVFESGLVVTRPIRNPSVQAIYCYETISETEWGIEPFKPNHYVSITKTIDQKILIMKEYQSELRPSPHPRSIEVLRATAVKRGSEAGFEHAEAFYVVRQLRVV